MFNPIKSVGLCVVFNTKLASYIVEMLDYNILENITHARYLGVIFYLIARYYDEKLQGRQTRQNARGRGLQAGSVQSRLLFVKSRPPAFTSFNRLLPAFTGFYWL